MSGEDEERLRAELDEALAERSRLWDERNRRLAAEAELAHARGLIASMSGSLSWRLTRPLRSAKAASGALRSRLGRAGAALRSRR